MRYIVVGKRIALACCLLGLCIGVVLVHGAVRIVRTVGATTHQYPIYSVETGRREVSLGINCAWDNGDIPELLRILEEHNVKATFFVVGEWCDNYPESVLAIHEAGHEIGSHSDTHADMTRLDRAGMVREIQDSAAKIEAITGRRPTLFRPPSGAYNDMVVEVIRQQGFYPIQWDCERIDIKTIKIYRT